jgi:hypothetical protein
MLLVAVAGCCGLMLGEVGATATDTTSFAKHHLSGSSEQQQQKHGFDVEDTDSFNRRLQTRACGDEIGRVTVAEMKALASTLLTIIFEKVGAAGFVQNRLKYFTSSLRYDIVVYKVCGSCAETQASLSEQALLQDESVFGAFSSYCGTDKYGYDAQHSALVFVPVTTETNSTATARTERAKVVEGSLRSFVSMHVTLVSVNRAPTQAWPTNLTEALTLSADPSELKFLLPYYDYLTPLVAAGSGAVSVLPDYIGYGASLKTHNRTYAYPPTYMQAAVTSWMSTKQAIEQDTYGWSLNTGNGCTAMDSVVTVAGNSEGGYAAIAAAPALQQAGVRVLSISAGATFLDPGEQLEFAIGMYQYLFGYNCVCGSYQYIKTSLFSLLLFFAESFDNGLVTSEKDNVLLYRMLPLNVFAFSSENPGLANSGTDQSALASEWRVTGNFDRDIISWIESPDPLTAEEIVPRMLPTNVPDIFNADYLDLVRKSRAADNTSFACNSEFVLENVTDKLCEAINSVSLLTAVANLDIPLQLCYSENDSVVSSRVYKDKAINVYGNANVTNFSGNGPLGFTALTRDHTGAIILCTVAPLKEFVDVESMDRSNLISPLMGEQANVCALSKTAPSSAPASSGAPLITSRMARISGTALAVALLSLSMS